jgi:hypothetical protein
MPFKASAAMWDGGGGPARTLTRGGRRREGATRGRHVRATVGNARIEH